AQTVFTLIINKFEKFFKENDLANIPFTPKNPQLPTIDEQLAYTVSFFDALKINTDQYVQQFNQLLREAQALDVTSIPDFSDDKDNTHKSLDGAYQDFKKHYDKVQESLRNYTFEIAHAESRNSMISSMLREMEGLQLAMNTSGYFLDPQKSSYFSLFITEGKVDGTKIKDFFKIPENPTDVQLKALGKQLLGLAGSKQNDIFTDQQKIDAGKLVHDSIKNKTDILQLSLDEMICLAQMYEDQYKNDSGVITIQANAARQTVYLLRTAGQLGWQEMQALINGQQDYGQINQGEALTNQLENIENFKIKLAGLPNTTGSIDEMRDQINSIQSWLGKVQNLIIGQEYSEGNLKDQSVIMSTEQIEDEWEISDIYGIGFARTL
ncbi:hypothetical protein EBU24_03880, partial [bacterium]|nr:hypothetical protein [bacterium]